MSKISLKTALCAVFFSLTALVLSVCILEPVTVNEYVEDDKVQVVIKRDAGRVNIITKKEWPDRFSDSGLTAGNGRILGLKNDKYYIIEEYVMEEGKNGELETTQFVKSDGTRSLNPTNIGKVRGGTITGLTNDRWYLVKSAEPLNKDDFSTTATNPISIKDGEITLPAGNYNLTVPAFDDYGFVKIPISPASPATSGTVSNSGITLKGEETVTDYIFFDLDLFDFYVLKVTIKPDESVTPGEIKVTVTFDPDADEGKKLALSSSTTTISKTALEAGGNLTLTIDTSGITTGTVGTTWFIVGGKTVSGSTPLTIKYGGNPNIDDLLVKGSLDVTVEVTINSTYYSKVFTVTIN